MRIGINSPVVTANPGAHAPWEQAAGIEELALIAETADRAGLHHLTCSEHVAVPAELAHERGATYWDPLATLGYLAARTEQILLVTQVLVLGYHHPLEIAKRYGTLDVLSGGRLVLGLGVGSIEAEFEMLGATWHGRGAIADDALRALRASLGRRTPSYHGSHFDFDDMVIEPHATREDVPLWIGGRTLLSLRRAIGLGEGWMPFGLPLTQISQMLADAELPEGFEVVLSPGRALDPLGDPAKTRERLDRLSAAGATIIGVSIDAHSAGHYCEQLEALAEQGLAQGLEQGVEP